MKTAQEIKQLMDSEKALAKRFDKDTSKPLVKKTMKKISFYKEMLFYIETNPKQSFLESEIKRIKELIRLTDQSFDYWNEHVCPEEIPSSKRRTLFNKENNILKHKTQLKNLVFLLE